jgi:hypothetical protein
MDIAIIVGQELTAVEFVQDHLQLRFEGPLLTMFVWPDVFREEGSYAYGEPEFRNFLCALISENVTAATLEEDEALEIEFESGVILRASLREEDLDVPEAGQFSESGVAGDITFEF